MAKTEEFGLFEAAPLSRALGAEVSGMDVRAALALAADAPLWRQIHRSFAAFKVLFFRDQDLSPDDLVAFASRFGPVGRYSFAEPLPENPDVIAVIKEPGQAANFGGIWHTDSPYLPAPSAASVLYALKVPDRGGDTIWADMVLALRELPGDVADEVRGLKAVHSAGKNKEVLRAEPLATGSMEGRNEGSMDVLEAAHPVIRTHPVTGQKSLYISPAHTTRFVGMDEEESAPLLEFLFEHVTQERFTCRFHWTPGTLAIWDNRCTLHYPLNDYPGEYRAMHRVTIDGEVPV